MADIPSNEVKQEIAYELDVKVDKDTSTKRQTRKLASSSSFRSAEGFTLSWTNITYKIQGKDQEKGIGSMLAIMGPSGSGKTTLLDVLAGRVASGELSGERKINGTIWTDSHKRICSYVMQDDTLQGSLTVRENLKFSANLKLPASYSADKRAQMVEELISTLGLRKVADTAIGDPFHRGVSGGERRRVSIGMELLALPKILFLDEPTSGLDSHSAFKICEYLRKIASEHKIAIVATIHQPSTSVFNSFDELILLSRGKQVYSGKRKNAVPYFGDAGFPLPPNTNPADFYADLINFDFEDNEGSEKQKVVEQLVEKFHKSQERERIIKKGNAKPKKELKTDMHEGEFASPFWRQLIFLLLRTVMVYIKNPAVVHVRIAMYAMMGFMIGTGYFDLAEDQSHIQDRMSLLFFAIAFLTFMSIAAFPALIEERLLFVRERANYYYRVSAFVVSHSIIQLPFTLGKGYSGTKVIIFAAMSLAFTLIAYWLANMHNGTEAFFYFLLTLWSALYISESLVMVIASFIPWYLIGIAVNAAMYGMFMLVNGFFVLKRNLPVGWLWAHYLSFQKYSFEGTFANEFEGRSFPCDPFVVNNVTSCMCLYPDYNYNCIVEDTELLKFFEYENVDKWENFGWLWLFTAVLRISFYIVLRFNPANSGKR